MHYMEETGTEKDHEKEIEKWLVVVVSARMKEDGMKIHLCIVMDKDVMLPYIKVRAIKCPVLTNPE